MSEERKKCKAKSKQTGQPCKRWPRKGYPVCSTHGAGTRKRERAGTRKNVRTAAVTTGTKTSEATWAEIRQLNPDFARLRDRYLTPEAEAKLRDVRELLASLWAMHDIVARSLPGATTNSYGDVAPPVLLPVLNAIAAGLERVARIEGRIKEGGVTFRVEEMRLYAVGVVEVINEFVPADRVEQALARIESLGLDDGDPGRAARAS